MLAAPSKKSVPKLRVGLLVIVAEVVILSSPKNALGPEMEINQNVPQTHE